MPSGGGNGQARNGGFCRSQRFTLSSQYMNTSPSLSPAGKNGRLFRILCLWILLPLLLLFAAGISSLFLLCAYKPELVAVAVQQYLAGSTGLPWRIRGEIRPVLLPTPGIVVSDVRILAATMDQTYLADIGRPLVRAKTLRIHMDPLSLLKLEPKARMIELDTPIVSLAYDAEQRPLWLPLSPEDTTCEIDAETEEEHAAHTAALEQALAAEQENSSTSLQSVTAVMCKPPSAAFQPVHIRNGSLNSYSAGGELLLSFTGIDGRFSPGAEQENLELSAVFAVPAATLDLRFTLSASIGCDGIPARGNISGNLSMTPPGSRPLLGTFKSLFTWTPDGNILLPDFSLVAEGDALTANLTLAPSHPCATGNVQIHRLSLPRWFAFGRVLPPGLRQTLDALVGEFELYLDMTKAEARNLRGVAGPLAITGYVGAPDFSNPVVTVDLDADRANLDLLLPFLAAVGRHVPDPLPPEFDHPYLAPFPSDPDAPPAPPDEPGIEVGYDVTVRVARPHVHDVDGGPLVVTVLPAVVDGKEKTRVAFSASSLITGTAEGVLDIDETDILMHYDVKGMDLALLPENADNTVKFSGKVTGTCDIGIPMLPDGELADDWSIKVNAVIANCAVVGHYSGSPWRLVAGTARAVGSGSIHSVRSNGIRIEGLWDLAVQKVNTSWNPKGNDKLFGQFKGGLFWLPIEDRPRETKGRVVTIEKKGVNNITGDLTLNGSLIVPIGSLLVPLTGSLAGDLDWRLYDEKIRLNNTAFTGFGSRYEGKSDIDFSGKQVAVHAETTFRINTPELLKGWDLSPPPGFAAPQLLSGRMEIISSGNSLKFDKIKLEADGAPVTGEISWQGESGSNASGPGKWSARLTARHLDIDRYVIPSSPEQKKKPPSKTPWDLSAFKGLTVDAQVTLQNAKWHKLSFAGTKLTAALQRDRFSLHSETKSFYGGNATFILQGTLLPDNSQVTLRKGLAQIQNADLSGILYDYSQEQSYGGKADMIIDAHGTLACNADIPAKLSGVWSLGITDGLYPAFLSGDNSTLRNTFSTASAGGSMENGVLQSNNFKLSGPMVDMSGGGWLNMVNDEHDVNVSVTFAKVPTVPVRFYSKDGVSRMQVRGMDMVLETMQAAGTTVFSVVMGVLELPGYAIKGIGSLFGSEPDKAPPKPAKPRNRPAQTLPVRPVPR